MRAATAPRPRRDEVRMLVVGDDVAASDGTLSGLLDLLGPGDVVVVNDAATLPASLPGTAQTGDAIELRLLGPSSQDAWRGVLFGAGSWRVATESRPPPPALGPGDRLQFAAGLGAEIVALSSISPRLVELRFNRRGSELWPALYRAGRPVQYSHLDGDLELWSVQTAYGTRPWAVEMPSVGRPLTWSLLLGLTKRGVTLAALTHAAGLSATGDPAIDDALPLPERYEIPPATVASIARARHRGGRVIAVGTTVTRALEGNAVQNRGELRAGVGITDLVIDESFAPAIVDGLLTGMHDPTESHFRLLQAFVRRDTLLAAWRAASSLGYLRHELGDTSLIAGRRLLQQNRPSERAIDRRLLNNHRKECRGEHRRVAQEGQLLDDCGNSAQLAVA